MTIDTLDDIDPPYREGEGEAFSRPHAKPFDPADPQAMRELVKAHGHLTRIEAYALIDALEEARGDAMRAVQALEGEAAELRAQLGKAKALYRTWYDPPQKAAP